MMWTIFLQMKGYLDKCKRDNIGAFAAQAAFFIIMSAIPFLLVFTSLLQYTPISEDRAVALIYDAIPVYIRPATEKILSEVYANSIGIISVTAVVALWSAGKALQYMASGMNVLNGIEESRNWLVVRFWSVIYTLIFLLAIIMVLVLMVFAEYLQKILDEKLGFLGIIISYLSVRPLVRGFMIMGVLSLLFLWLFSALPNRKQKKIKVRNQIPGAVLCAVIWYAFSFFLSLYVNYFPGFTMYGSMSTLVLIMFWLYSCMYIMFMCAEMNVYFETIILKFAKRIIKK